ncbi:MULTISPECIES: hypothetical protein [unclassified Mucilaginibacter]|uniref:hypothetical protein n=1 Tax=unclassified Mucilaginibacter TaxID=2617802 RepID=UPI000958EE7A|nr:MULTISPECIES: hypothetical protein [unclassified Mucilaginibacter]OJW13537.1 MAG: hypothetical protein BGO48_01930 [Mucilaginibacter sp. 44-25]PLW89776.1 MAG: hypothetical protein C0154_09805 [Mucilaginibacter sp.]HEK20984.1 hypothetical protein [Bacteroidota bacterium]
MSNNQDQLPFYNTKQVADNIVAFVKLKEAINGLNKPLNDISRNVKDLNGSFDKLVLEVFRR